MLFNSIPTYLLTEMKGPLLPEFTLQSQSQSKKKQHSRRRQAEMLPPEANAATTGYPRKVSPNHQCAPGSPHIFQRGLEEGTPVRSCQDPNYYVTY